jgi:hypothetical protein
MTLDGVMEGPGHDEHPDGKNAWALQHAADDMQRYKIEELFAVDALLLGRVTYQIRSLDAAQNVDRVLATVLFTDIVDSERNITPRQVAEELRAQIA